MSRLKELTSVVSERIRQAHGLRTMVLMLGLFVFVVNFFSPHLLDSVIGESFVGKFFTSIFISCEDFEAVRILLLVLCFALSSFVVVKYHGSPFGRNLAWFICLPLALWIFFDFSWKFPSLIWSGDFRYIYSGLLVAAGVFLIIWRKRNDSADNNLNQDNTATGFSSDDNSLESSYAEDLAIDLVDRLKLTDVSYSAFSMGIVGDWGSGKSRFLQAVKSHLDNSNEIFVEFNPWLALSDKSLIQSFFNVLTECVSSNISDELTAPLQDYADAVTAIEGNDGLLSRILSFFKLKNDDNPAILKEKISTILKEKQRSVFVFIDDLDRLNGEEIFEVLRLIRNTADFPHIFYISAYDQDYVSHMLEQSGISFGKKYLAKIFNLEMSMPKVPDTVLDSLFRSELTRMGLVFEEGLVNNWSKLVVEYLSSFRDIKRFCRQFALIYNKISNRIGKEEFYDDDLFTLQLLEYCDNKLYEKVKRHDGDLLRWDTDSRGRWVISLPSMEAYNNLLYHDPKLLVKRLFADVTNDNRALRYIDCFNRYFTYQHSEYTITIREFEEWVNEGNEALAAEKFSRLVDKASDKRSLLFRISSAQLHLLSVEKLSDVAKHLLKSYFSGNYSHKEVKQNLLHSIACIHKDCRINLNQFYTSIDEFLKSDRLNHVHNKHRNISDLLKDIRKDVAESNDNIRELEKSNFQEFLESEKPDPKMMSDNTSSLYLIYQNSIEWKSYVDYDGFGEPIEYKSGETPLIDIMADYFMENPSPNGKAFMESLFYYPSFDSAGEVEYYDELPDSEIEDIKINYFGSVANYEKFMVSAFK